MDVPVHFAGGFEVYVVLEISRDHSTHLAGVYSTRTLAEQAASQLSTHTESAIAVGESGITSEVLVIPWFLNGHRGKGTTVFEKGTRKHYG